MIYNLGFICQSKLYMNNHEVVRSRSNFQSMWHMYLEQKLISPWVPIVVKIKSKSYEVEFACFQVAFLETYFESHHGKDMGG